MKAPRAVVARLCYAGDETVSLKDKYVYLNLGLEAKFDLIAARTDARGYLCTSARPDAPGASPLWLDRDAEGPYLIYCSSRPLAPDAQLSPEQCQPVRLKTWPREGGGEEHILPLQRIKLTFEVGVGLNTPEAVGDWLFRNRMIVHVDGQEVRAAAAVDDDGDVLVTVKLEAGTHELVIASEPLNAGHTGSPVVYLSEELTVLAED